MGIIISGYFIGIIAMDYSDEEAQRYLNKKDDEFIPIPDIQTNYKNDCPYCSSPNVLFPPNSPRSSPKLVRSTLYWKGLECQCQESNINGWEFLEI